jgi:hypothetical protein
MQAQLGPTAKTFGWVSVRLLALDALGLQILLFIRRNLHLINRELEPTSKVATFGSRFAVVSVVL